MTSWSGADKQTLAIPVAGRLRTSASDQGAVRESAPSSEVPGRAPLSARDLADSFDPQPKDEERLLNAIARRNTTWAHYESAVRLLRGAETRYAGAELAPFIRNANEAQHDFEWAVRDLVYERVRYRSGR